RAAVHHGGGHRQRVHRGGGRLVPVSAGRNRARPLHHHADRELAVAPPHLEHGAELGGGPDGRAGRGAHPRNRMTHTAFRKLLSSACVVFCAASVLIALVPLAFILFFVVTQGMRAVNLDFFTNMPRPVGEAGGGMANSIVGTLIVTGLASLMAVPIGVISGIYMSEYAGTR